MEAKTPKAEASERQQGRAQAMRDVAAMLRTQADALERCGLVEGGRQAAGPSDSRSTEIASWVGLVCGLLALACAACWWMTGVG